eukprot:13202255-Alexandrium_andersonii.AAC.1
MHTLNVIKQGRASAAQQLAGERARAPMCATMQSCALACIARTHLCISLWCARNQHLCDRIRQVITN